MPIQDAPDSTVWVEPVSVVADTPTPPSPAHEWAAGGVGNYPGSSTDWEEVVRWTVKPGRVGELKEILIITNDYGHTVLQVTVGTVDWATNWSPTASMPIIFEDLRLAAGTVVLVEAKSSDGTPINVDAIIVGKEVG
ncbi:hypothetical protein ES708_24925 [subsurface metagenome]